MKMTGKKKMWRGCAMGLCAALVLTGLCACGGNGDGDGGTATTVSTTATTAATTEETTTATETTETTTTTTETPATAATTAAKVDPYQIKVNANERSFEIGEFSFRYGDDADALIAFLGKPQQEGPGEEIDIQFLGQPQTLADKFIGTYFYVYVYEHIIVAKTTDNKIHTLLIPDDTYSVNGIRLGDTEETTEKTAVSLWGDPAYISPVSGGFPRGITYKYEFDDERPMGIFLYFSGDTNDIEGFIERGKRAEPSASLIYMEISLYV